MTRLGNDSFVVSFNRNTGSKFDFSFTTLVGTSQHHIIKRALHYPFNWIRFLEINKLCNVIAENLTFSTNRKLISISWKVWTCSNFSTNWKWKWMNRIRHGRRNVVGKQKFELIWKVTYLYKSNQFACY